MNSKQNEIEMKKLLKIIIKTHNLSCIHEIQTNNITKIILKHFFKRENFLNPYKLKLNFHENF
jgi:hypothetical protein